MKRMQCLVLALAMLGSMLLSVPVMAEEPAEMIYEEGDFRYAILDDGTAEITKYTGTAKVLAIPAVLGGYPVTRIGDRAFYNCKSLTDITIPDSVTSIGYEAFYVCIKLTSVTIPDSVTRIGDRAFEACTSLTSIMIPDSVIEVGANPLLSCKKLTEVTVSPDHPTLAVIDGVLFSKPDKRLISYPCAFSLESYSIPQ